MRKKLTKIELPGESFPGIMDWGEKTRDEMIRMYRHYARQMRAEAMAILRAEDNDYKVTVIRGPYVQHFIKELKPDE